MRADLALHEQLGVLPQARPAVAAPGAIKRCLGRGFELAPGRQQLRENVARNAIEQRRGDVRERVRLARDRQA